MYKNIIYISILNIYATSSSDLQFSLQFSSSLKPHSVWVLFPSQRRHLRPLKKERERETCILHEL